MSDDPDAYVIADYLLVAAVRLHLHGPRMKGAVERVLERYAPWKPDSLRAAKAFLDQIEYDDPREDLNDGLHR